MRASLIVSLVLRVNMSNGDLPDEEAHVITAEQQRKLENLRAILRDLGLGHLIHGQ